MKKVDQEAKLRNDIEKKIKKIFSLRKKDKKFIPGKSWIQYAGGVFDHKEINASVDSLIDGWFGLGVKGEALEKKLAAFVGAKGSILTNSGSSANLLAVTSLLSYFYPNHLNPGDEVITAACGFPTTVNPLFQNNLKPVFVDVEPDTYNVTIENLEKAVSKKTRAVILAHTLGNPFEVDRVVEFCKAHNLFFIEDNCDALGSKYNGKRTGGFGLLATQSFYPPHHMTIGEGGAIHYNDLRFERITKSLRDWGRSCWCPGDEKRTWGTCGARFNYRIDGKLYDHKYMFNQIGYNLKPIEAQAAMGLEQIKRVPGFTRERAYNFKRFFEHAKRWEKYFILPRSLPLAQPSWFAFPLTIRDGVKFSRMKLALFLEERMIQTRPLFGGNLTHQLAYAKSRVKYRQVGNLANSTRILHNTFFVGIYPALGDQEIDYIAQSIDHSLKREK